jgi:hypothetical protein
MLWCFRAAIRHKARSIRSMACLARDTTMRLPRMFRRDVPEVVSLRFGHDSALTAIQAVIHYLVAASLPPEGCINLFMQNPSGEPIAPHRKIRTSGQPARLLFLLVSFLVRQEKYRCSVSICLAIGKTEIGEKSQVLLVCSFIIPFFSRNSNHFIKKYLRNSCFLDEMHKI